MWNLQTTKLEAASPLFQGTFKREKNSIPDTIYRVSSRVNTLMSS